MKFFGHRRKANGCHQYPDNKRLIQHPALEQLEERVLLSATPLLDDAPIVNGPIAPEAYVNQAEPIQLFSGSVPIIDVLG